MYKLLTVVFVTLCIKSQVEDLVSIQNLVRNNLTQYPRGSTLNQNLANLRNSGNPYCASYNDSGCALCYNSANVNGVCQPVENHIEYCQRYLANGECLECNSKFQLVNEEGNQYCQEIELSDCIRANNGRCTQCSKNILVDANGECHSDNECQIHGCHYCNLQNGQENCAWCRDSYSLVWLTNRWECLDNDEYLLNGNIVKYDGGESDEEEIVQDVTSGFKGLHGCHYRTLDTQQCRVCFNGYALQPDGTCMKSHEQYVDLSTGVFRVCSLVFALLMF